MGERERSFFDGVARASSERAIATLLMDAGEAITGAQAIGYYKLGGAPVASEVHVRGLSQSVLDAYEAGARVADPLFQWVADHQVAAEVDTLVAAEVSPAYAHFLADNELAIRNFRQYMLAPIVNGTELVGMMHFARISMERFEPEVLRFAMALAVHVSTRVGILHALDSFAESWDGVLTKRELEIAELAVRGLSTATMARAAGISVHTVKKYLRQLYQKLHVASRAELGSMMLRGPRALDARLALPLRRELALGSTAFIYGS